MKSRKSQKGKRGRGRMARCCRAFRDQQELCLQNVLHMSPKFHPGCCIENRLQRGMGRKTEAFLCGGWRGTMLIQTRNTDCSDLVGSKGGVEKWFDSGYIFKVDPT